MTEFIGSRISLISKRDIRYVGTLHEINSENSTVALEQVVSYGTEGRRPDDEVPASTDNVYEYIVFRGSDVKDLRIEEGPKESAPKPRVPDDPAILGSTRKPPESAQQQQQQQQQQSQQGPPGQRLPGGPPQGPIPGQQQGPHQPPFGQQNFPHNYGPPQRFGGPPQFPPGPYGYPPGPGPYGAPPGWYPPQGYPQMPPGQFPPQMPIGPPGQGDRGSMAPPQPAQAHNIPTPSGSAPPPEDKQQFTKPDDKQNPAVRLPASSTTPIPLQEAPSGPSPGLQKTSKDGQAAPTGSSAKPGRIVPAIPKPAAATNGNFNPTLAQVAAGTAPSSSSKGAMDEANRNARAAVAAAMAKLPAAAGTKKPGDDGALDNLSKKVSELRTTENARTSRPGQPGSSQQQQQTLQHSYRGGRGGGSAHRGGRQAAAKVEIPDTDYDFASANAKFNKQDLVKEAIASGSPIHTPGESEPSPPSESAAGTNGAAPPKEGSEVSAAAAAAAGATNAYNRKTSFFDDISSEIKDRAGSHDFGQRLGGREFRNEERQKNLETFGQGSVDNSYRYRGRGRGRGYGRGRGRGGRGRGGGAVAEA